jgi:hypothetical protein
VPDCVHKLAATTFVQAVEAPTLSIMVPLLVRGLRHDNTTAIKRKVGWFGWVWLVLVGAGWHTG